MAFKSIYQTEGFVLDAKFKSNQCGKQIENPFVWLLNFVPYADSEVVKFC